MVEPGLATRVAEQAAYAAGTHLLASRSRLVEVVVTRRPPEAVAGEIEREVLGLIRGVVLRHFPDHAFVAGASAALPQGGRPAWVVAAIDGGANYLRGYPQYAVSIALVTDGEPLVGVVYDPCRNEFFGALRGQGAVLNGAPIRCAPARPAIEAMAATVFPRPGSARMAGYMGELGRVLRGFGGARRSGSTALEMAYLAAGRLDAFWRHDSPIGKTAAGMLLLRESGALVQARDGAPLFQSRSLMACTPALCGPLLDLLGPA